MDRFFPFNIKAQTLSLLAVVAFLHSFSLAQETENRFNKPGHGDIALRVVNMLEDEHYLRQGFSDEMSSKVLDTYIEMLDYGRTYFTQADIDRFDAEFRFKIDDQVRNEVIPAAYEIYSIYEKRVRSRIKLAKALLKENNFTFDSDRVVDISRKETKWAASGEEHDQLWRNLIEGDLLREFIADEAAKRFKAKEKAKGKSKPEKKEEEKKVSDREKIEKRYDRVLKTVTTNKTEDVAKFFIKAIARSYDPHSEYFSQSEYENFQIGMNKSLIGIGAMLQKDEEKGGATIEGLVVGGPAKKNGELQYKDRILGVGQGEKGEIKDVVADDLSDIVDLIRGEKGTTVRLKVSPLDSPDETKMISIVREKVDLKENLASADLIITKDPAGREQKIGWVRLSSFYSDMGGGEVSATADVYRLIQRLEIEGIDGLVVDLSNDGGGSLEEAINLTGLFIRKGPVVQARDWRGQRTQKSSRAQEAVYDGPLVVLTNRASASASEIFAAALQDYNRAVIVGEKSTFGKGTVQQLRPVTSSRLRLPFRQQQNQKGALKLTIQTFFRIDGTSTQLDGVIPDVRLPSTLDVADIGEASMRGPLKVDPIEKASYAPYFAERLPVDILGKASALRVASDQAFKYVQEDIAAEKKRLAENVISLNKAKRLANYDELDAKRESRKVERIARFAATRKAEDGLITTYTFIQDNVMKKEKTLKGKLSEEELSGMSRGKKKKEEEDPEVKALEYPHLMNPYQRETVRILQDLIAISKTGKPVNISKVAPGPAVPAVQPN